MDFKILFIYFNISLDKIKILISLHKKSFRMTPVLAAMVLLYATTLSRLGNGPVWHHIEESLVEPCKTYWWTSLLYIQNYINPNDYVTQVTKLNFYLTSEYFSVLYSPGTCPWICKCSFCRLCC